MNTALTLALHSLYVDSFKEWTCDLGCIMDFNFTEIS